MTGLIIAVLTLGLILSLGIRTSVFSGDQARRMRWRTRMGFRPGPGYATLPEMIFRWGRLPAALSHGGRARPSTTRTGRLITSPSQYARYLGRGPGWRRCWAPLEEQALILSGPRRGKTGIIGDWAIEHPGPAIIIGYPDLWDATAGYRHQTGPVDVINPEHAGSIPTTFGWDIISGCDDPAEAIRRATDLVGAVAEGDMAWWVEKAAAALSGGMHAAGVIASTPPPAQHAVSAMAGVAAGLNAAAAARADMSAVWSWANGASGNLIKTAAPYASEQLLVALAELQRTGKSADSIRLTMTKSLTWLAIPSIAQMVTGPAARPFDVPALIRGRGTIYMIAPDGDDAPAAPLYRCFASYVHRQARACALAQPPGRRKLDPGLLLAIDELHLAPLPLPRLLADSAGHGIQIAAVVHSYGQLEDKYGEHGARTVWQTAGTKMFLPGIADTDTLDTVSKLAGDVRDGEHYRTKAPAEFVRRLPRWRALVISADLSALVVKFRPYWRRPAFRLGRQPRPPLPGSGLHDTQPIPAIPPDDIPGAVPGPAICDQEPADDIPA